VLWACSSYSEYVYGVTGNAAYGGLSWDMSILPKESGLSVNGVIYQYTPVKNPTDAMLVHVQNLNAKGNGYIFRETDDWTGRPATPISKVIPVDNIPIQYWGRGSIDVEGQGSVKDAKVAYSYRIDPCFEPVPGCPNYVPKIPEIQVYSALDDDAVKISKQKTEQEYKEQKIKETKETQIKVAKDAEAVGQSQLLQALNGITNLTAYYSLSLNGGVYRETISLKDTKIPENRSGLRNGLAQQILHDKMVNQQYVR
jgi:hypothetical protein